MPDWRWVTSVRNIPAAGAPQIIEGMWIDFDGLDQIMPLTAHDYRGAHTRLGWMTSEGWQHMLIAEAIMQPPGDKGEENADPFTGPVY